MSRGLYNNAGTRVAEIGRRGRDFEEPFTRSVSDVTSGAVSSDFEFRDRPHYPSHMNESSELDKAALPGLAILSGVNEARALLRALEPPATAERGARTARNAGAASCYRRQPVMKSRPHTNHCKPGVISGNLAVCQPTQVRLVSLRRLSTPAVPTSRCWLAPDWPKLCLSGTRTNSCSLPRDRLDKNRPATGVAIRAALEWGSGLPRR
jgi:hypothetical protein